MKIYGVKFMNKTEAVEFLKTNLSNQNMIKHCLASGAVMRALAIRLGQNLEEWEVVGILHDADAEKTPAERQGATVGEWLVNKLSSEQVHAMAAHNEATGVVCATNFDWALYASEKLTGLIVATTLVLPSKKLADVTVENVLRRFKEKGFAKGASRENIIKCEKLGLSLEEFVGICLPAMQEIAPELGL